LRLTVEYHAAKFQARVDRSAQTTKACHECGGSELLVADEAYLDLPGTGTGSIKIAAIICRTCGDIRMRALELAKLPRCERTDDPGFLDVVVPKPPSDGPFR
jgi:hypothetical protein